jgi:hypothetical protein
MKITLNIEAGSVDELEAALARLVGNLESSTTLTPPTAAPKSELVISLAGSEPLPGGSTVEILEDGSPVIAATDLRTVAKRERGKPAPGRQKRNSVEVAEDKAADEADAAALAAGADPVTGEVASTEVWEDTDPMPAADEDKPPFLQADYKGEPTAASTGTSPKFQPSTARAEGFTTDTATGNPADAGKVNNPVTTTAAATTEGPTDDQLQTAMTTVIAERGFETAKGILAKLGVNRMGDAAGDVAKRTAIHNALQAALL